VKAAPGCMGVHGLAGARAARRVRYSVAAASAVNDDFQLARSSSQQAAVLLSDQGHNQDWQTAFLHARKTQKRRTSQEGCETGASNVYAFHDDLRLRLLARLYSVRVVPTCVI